MLLRPIFCEKLKIAPPHRKTAPPETFEFPNLAEKSDSISAKTLLLLFFWRAPDFGRKKPLNFGFRPKNQTQFRRRPFFFFGDHLILGGKNLRISEKFRLNFRTNRVKLIQEQSKFGSRSFALFSLFQNSPPPLFQILATRLNSSTLSRAISLN